jgi:hypothetical protein
MSALAATRANRPSHPVGGTACGVAHGSPCVSRPREARSANVARAAPNSGSSVVRPRLSAVRQCGIWWWLRGLRLGFVEVGGSTDQQEAREQHRDDHGHRWSRSSRRPSSPVMLRSPHRTGCQAAVKRRYFALVRIVVATQPRRGPGWTPLLGWSMKLLQQCGRTPRVTDHALSELTTTTHAYSVVTVC